MNVRRAVPGDETIVRDLRLRALTESPREFDSTAERESGFASEDWTRWITNGATFLFEDGGEPHGLATGFPDREGTPVGFLVSMWVHPDFRGAGAADRLIQSVIAWAEGAGLSALRLHVTRDNHRARRCYERNGFRFHGTEIERERDGIVELEMDRPLHTKSG